MNVGKRGGLAHLVRRSFSVLFRRRTPPEDAVWARGWLSETEQHLFDRLPSSDRAHSVRVARRVEVGLRDGVPGPDPEVVPRSTVLAAALLHDVGKGEARLGIYGRVVATLCGLFADEALARAWASRSGITRRIGLYLQYTELGAESLELVGSDPLVVAWSREHHDPPEEWTVPPAMGEVLAAADY